MIHLQSFVHNLFHSLNLTFWSSECFRTCFLMYSLNLTFICSEYKETIIHIFHSFLHGGALISDNSIRSYSFFDFFSAFIKKCMNLIYQYLCYFSFNYCNFWFTHIQTYSITKYYSLIFILSKFSYKVYCEEASTKRPVVQ